MRGPVPNPDRLRTNAPVVPTTKLPASGRPGPTPRAPAWYVMGKPARAWWRWAWSTPQAVAWSPGEVPLVARRACLEDDFAVAAIGAGRVTVMREMRELDDRLGLTPKSMAAMRWVIVDDSAAVEDAVVDVSPMAGRRVRLADAS